MGYKETYNRWLTSDVVDDDTKAELKSIENNVKEIEERFYRELQFGTAGMRGIIGAVIIVVSEETGKISIALNGSLTRLSQL